MSKEIVVQPQPRAWLEDSVLQPYVSRYGAHLRRGRYAPSTQRIYLCCVAHFAHWLTGEQYGLNAIGEAVVACFLSEHMPACACPYADFKWSGERNRAPAAATAARRC